MAMARSPCTKLTFLFSLLAINVICINLTLYSYWREKSSRHERNDVAFSSGIMTSHSRDSNQSDVTADRLKERLGHVIEECRRANDTTPLEFKSLKNTDWPWIYVSHRYKLLYCQIPKVGTSNWLKLFAAMEGKINATKKNVEIHNAPLLLLSYLNVTMRDEVMRSYKKFMVVRDPFQRAVSAYQDKFALHPGHNAPMFVNLARQIVDKYRSSRITRFPENRASAQKVPTFEEFVEYLTDPNNSAIITHYSEPRHWQPQTELCYPCNIDYDFIMDIANIDDDSEFVLRLAGVPVELKYAKIGKSSFKTELSSQRYNPLIYQYYSKVEPKLVNDLYHYYKKDFDVLGFDIPPQF